MMSPFRFALPLLAAAATASAQQAITTATIAGRVQDATGAAIAHAQVSAISKDTNHAYRAQADAQGRFRLSFLPAGEYSVSAQADGFAALPPRTLAANADSAFNLTLQLQVPGVAARMDVLADTPVIEAGRAEIAETVQPHEMEDLPYAGRNYLDLPLLLPGVSATNTASTQVLAETSETVGQGLSVNSQRNFSNSFVVDGLSANDDAAGVAGDVLSIDSVREFQAVTSGGEAEFGRALGGYFNIVTRGGTDQLRGTAYGFLRNQRLNAANALTGTTLPLTAGQYGASIGGPLQRDRSFAFANFEEERLRTSGVLTIAPANAAAIDARLLAIGYAAPLLPVSATPTSTYPTTLHTDTVFVRGDRSFAAHNDRLEARYHLYQLSSLNARGTGALNAVSNGTSVYDVHHTFAVGNTATLTPRLLNETRAQVIVDDLNAPPNDLVGPVVTISGVATFGRSTSSPTQRNNVLGEIVDNLQLDRGAHAVKFGADYLYNADTITFPMSIRGAYTFSSLASFLAGTYNTQGYTQNFGIPVVQQGNSNVGVYVQDAWKALPKLTLNVGLRYDLERLLTVNTDANNVSPRFGFAWSPYTDGRTVVRGSYGLFYDRIPLRPLANALLSANNTTDPSQAALLSYSFTPGQAGAPIFPQVAATPPAGALLNYTLLDRNIQNPFSQQASLGVEQQIGPASTLGISWQHLRGEHLIGSVNGNINPDGTRPDPTRGNVKSYRSAFDSYFDALEVSVQQRPVPWGSARLSYAWSKAIDNLGEFFFSAPVNNGNLREDRSRSDDDQRHRVTFSAELTAPSRTAHTVAEHLAYGWRLSGILQYSSRLPFNIVTGANTKQATAQRPCASGYALTATAGLNPCTEALPGALIGRNAGIGFDAFTLSSRLSRTIALTERLHLECMAEAFNALNHRNNLLPNTTFGTGTYPLQPSATFGQPTAVGDARSVQLAARLTF